MLYSESVCDKRALAEAISRAAVETKLAFSREIGEMFNRGRYGHLVFLSIAYIEVDIKVEMACYNGILNDLGCDLGQKAFDDLIKEFSGEVETSLFGILRYITPHIGRLLDLL